VSQTNSDHKMCEERAVFHGKESTPSPAQEPLLTIADGVRPGISGVPAFLDQPRLPGLVAKTMVSHTLTYFIMGALAAFLNYAAVMARPESGIESRIKAIKPA
jgi:hypothetical protein